MAWLSVLLSLVLLNDRAPGNTQTAYEHVRQLFLHGYLETSQREAARAYRRYESSNPQAALQFQLLEARAMVWRGMYDDAMLLLAALSSPSRSPEETVQALTTKGVALTHQRQFAAADSTLSEAETICLHAGYRACGELRMARGVLLVRRGQMDEAHRVFLDGLAFAQAEGDRWLEAVALLNLGWAALQTEHYDEVMNWSQAANRVAAGEGFEDLAQVSSANLGWAYFELGDKEKALELFFDAERSAVNLGNLRDELKWLTDIGYVYTDQGKIEQARSSYGNALAMARKIRSAEDIADILTDLGLVAIASGNPQQAESYANQALSLALQNGSHPDMLDATAIEAQAAALRGDTARAEQLLGSVHSDPESQTSMLWASAHALANAYERQGKTGAAQAAYLSALTTFESARADLHQVNSQLPFLSNATGIYDDYIHFLVTQGKPEEALRIADQSRARTLAEGLRQASNPPAAQAAPQAPAEANAQVETFAPQELARKADATLLFYWLGARQSYLWAITPRKTQLYPLPSQAEITPCIERYRRALTGPEDPLSAGDTDGPRLYSMLVAPAADLLRTYASKPVMMLTDGPLSELNFETLVAGGPRPHYWIEDATILAAPSLAMLAAAQPQRSGSRSGLHSESPAGSPRILLIGDPATASGEYARLPHAGAEMQLIGRHFDVREQVVFSQRRATPAAYLRSDPGKFAYIHFVSHGVASRTDPLDSAIILSRANPADDAFKLYAREIMQLPLHARLVTISACYGTGTRAYAGEGLVGLSWAFLRAGAHNTIGALWEASDEATPRLMDALYKGLAEGQSPATALRNAKLTLLHSRSVFRKPYYWAPFQIYTRL